MTIHIVTVTLVVVVRWVDVDTPYPTLACSSECMKNCYVVSVYQATVYRSTVAEARDADEATLV